MAKRDNWELDVASLAALLQSRMGVIQIDKEPTQTEHSPLDVLLPATGDTGGRWFGTRRHSCPLMVKGPQPLQAHIHLYYEYVYHPSNVA